MGAGHGRAFVAGAAKLPQNIAATYKLDKQVDRRLNMSVVFGGQGEFSLIEKIDEFLENATPAQRQPRLPRIPYPVEGDFNGVRMTALVYYVYFEGLERTVIEIKRDALDSSICLEVSLNVPNHQTKPRSGPKNGGIDVGLIRNSCSIDSEHKGALMLEFVDALAAHFNKSYASLQDAAGKRGIGLSWLRAMIKGKGWYESRGYFSHPQQHARWQAAVLELRAKPVASMLATCRSAVAYNSGLTKKTSPAVKTCNNFVRLAEIYTDGNHAPDFGSFVEWLLETDPVALRSFYKDIFKGDAPQLPLPHPGGWGTVTWVDEMTGWQRAFQEKPKFLKKTYV